MDGPASDPFEIYFCDKCSKRIKPGVKPKMRGQKRICPECAVIPRVARGSQRLKTAPQGIRGASAVVPAEPTQIPEGQKETPETDKRKRVIFIASGAGVLLVVVVALFALLGGDDPEQVADADGPPQKEPPALPPTLPHLPEKKEPPTKPAGKDEPKKAPEPPDEPKKEPPAPEPKKQEKPPSKPKGPTPAQRLAQFKKEFQKTKEDVKGDRYRAAQSAFRKLQDDYAEMPWWGKEQDAFDRARNELQQLMREGREESEDACSLTEKADAAALAKMQTEWAAIRKSAPDGELTAEWAQNVLNTIAVRRRTLQELARKQLVAELEKKLEPFERSLERLTRFTQRHQDAYDELEALAIRDTDLVERYGKRLAELRRRLRSADVLSVYGAQVRKKGSARELTFDFSSASQTALWHLDDPNRHAKVRQLPAGKGLQLQSSKHHEWWGRDRKNTPIYRLPFHFLPGRWAVEVDVELMSEKGNKGYGAGIVVWSGGPHFVALIAHPPDKGKGHLTMLGSSPQRPNHLKESPEIPLQLNEPIRLLMGCSGDTVACSARIGSGVIPVHRERLGFVPKYVGLMVRTNQDMVARARFKDFKIIGVPDMKQLQSIRELKKEGDVNRIHSELKGLARAGEAVAKGKAFPLDLSTAATVASSKRLGRLEEERLTLPRYGLLTVNRVPFVVPNPQGEKVANVILLKGDDPVSRAMPSSVKVPCGMPAGTIHLLSGISIGGFPGGEKGSHTLTLKLHYADGQTEEYVFKNGVQFADYSQTVNVPLSLPAISHSGCQVRYIPVVPKRPKTAIKELEFLKGTDGTAPFVLAVTVDPQKPLPKIYNLGFKNQAVVEGRLGKALACDGKRKFEVQHHDDLEPDVLTLEAWVKMEAYPQKQGRRDQQRRWIVSKGANEAQDGHYGLLVKNDTVAAYARKERQTAFPQGGKLELNKWHHIAMTISQNKVLVFLDGKRVAQASFSGPRQKSDGTFSIGVRPDGHRPFKGLIDEVRVYDRVISEAEMKLHAVNPAAASRDGLVGYWDFESQ